MLHCAVWYLTSDLERSYQKNHREHLEIWQTRREDEGDWGRKWTLTLESG